MEKLNTITATEILDMDLPPIKSIISRILPTGTFIFAGASKIGKSWMVLWLANQISLGKPVWEFETAQNEVLYLALEDNIRRLQNRLNEIADEVGPVHFTVKSAFIGDGLEEQLTHFITEYPNVKLIIIDTLQKVRKSGKDKFAYADDYDVIGKIKAIGDKYDVTFLIIHHTRKEGDNDAINTISGTNGIVGSADGAFVLQKDSRMQDRATMMITGRDVQNITLRLEFNSNACKWELLSHSDNEVATSDDPLFVALDKFITADNPKWNGTATSLLDELKSHYPSIDVKANALSRKLNANSDILFSKYNIAYRNKRVATEKHIFLEYIAVDMYDNNGISGMPPTPKNTDNIAHIVQG